MSGLYSNDKLNVYIAVALIAGIIAVLAVSFYYDIQINSNSPSRDKVAVAVVTVTATKIVYVKASSTTVCSTNQTSALNSTVTC